MKRCLIVLASTLLLVPGLAADDELPVWDLGFRFEGSQSIAFTAELSGGTVTLQGSSDDLRFDLNDIGVRQHQRGTMEEYNVYVLSYHCTASFTGTASFTEPIPFVAEIEIPLAEWSGEYWVRQEDLAIVTRRRIISGAVRANLFGEWLDIGDAELDVSEELQPPLADARSPRSVGPHWRAGSTLCAYAP